MKRQRGRGRRSGGAGNNLNKHFESNGPDVKIRGSAQQILDKYLQYARDAQTSGDRVMSEAYFQHAEHYQRLIESMQPRDKGQGRQGERGEDDGQDDSDEVQAETNPSGTGETSQPDTEKPRRSRTPRRKEETETSDGLKVIDNDGDASDVERDSSPTGETGEAPAKPKRRRTYKRKDPTGETQSNTDGQAAASDEGVMSTLARGREEDVQETSKIPAGSGEDDQSSGDPAKAAAR